MENLKKQIEKKRKYMHTLIDKKDYDNIVKVSQELDILINKFNSLILIKNSRT